MRKRAQNRSKIIQIGSIVVHDASVRDASRARCRKRGRGNSVTAGTTRSPTITHNSRLRVRSCNHSFDVVVLCPYRRIHNTHVRIMYSGHCSVNGAKTFGHVIRCSVQTGARPCWQRHVYVRNINRSVSRDLRDGGRRFSRGMRRKTNNNTRSNGGEERVFPLEFIKKIASYKSKRAQYYCFTALSCG